MPELSEVHRSVERDWNQEQSRAADQRFYQTLRDRYSVEIHYPQTAKQRPDDALARVR